MQYREKLLTYASETYGTQPEYLWAKTPDAAVLRHRSNAKWYGLIMNVPKFGGDILNVKCDPLLADSLIEKSGYAPAYHMNKTHWITVLLNGQVSFDEICRLLDFSYQLTGGCNSGFRRTD